MGNLGRTIDRLHAAGIGVVHLVSDHGFLLLPGDAVDALGTPQVLPIQAQHKDVRWAVLKPDAPAGEVIRLPLPLAAEVLLGLPRGVRTLMKAPAFMHGGISLQECVVGHFVSRAAVRQAQIDLDLRVTTAELSGGTVPVILRPVVADLQQPLGGLQPLIIRLWVETEAALDATPRRVTEDIEVELRADVEEIRPPVYLKEGLALKAGQQLLLKAVEKQTGRDLGVVALKLLVDWD